MGSVEKKEYCKISRITLSIEGIKLFRHRSKAGLPKAEAMVTRQVSLSHSGIMGNCNISCWKGVCRQVDYIPRLFTDRGFFYFYYIIK